MIQVRYLLAQYIVSKIPNHKFQIPNKPQIPISNYQTGVVSGFVSDLGDWNLFGIWCLGFSASIWLQAMPLALESYRDSFLFQKRFNLGNRKFPIMKNGSRKHCISLSENQSFIKMLESTHTSRGNDRDSHLL